LTENQGADAGLCEVCGKPLPSPGAECPHCGHSNDISSILPAARTTKVSAEPASKHVRPSRLWLYGVMALVALLLVAALAGAYGVYTGLQQREDLRATTVAEHYQRGLDSLEAQEYELALAEFQYVDRLRPGYHDTRTQIEKVEAVLQQKATPTAGVREEAAASLLARAQDEIESESWTTAVATLRELQALDPGFHAEQVNALLAQSMYGAGTEALSALDVTRAADWFKQSLALNPESVDVRRQVTLANLYLQALSTWGKDWPATIDGLTQLHNLSPTYADTADRLALSYMRYGDQLSAGGEWCEAAEQYALSAEMKSSAAVTTKEQLAVRYCEEPPSATPETEGTPDALGTPLATTPAGLTSLPAGSLYFAATDPQTGAVSVMVLSAGPGQRPRTLVVGAEQPAVRADGSIGYHNLSSDRLGVSVATRDGSFAASVTSYSEDQYPTWEAGNARLAFASTRESDRKWRLYVAQSWTGGEDVSMIGYGKSPTWGPDGTIAYKGCDAMGNNCGLYRSLPDGTQLGRVTDNANDDMPAWSPDGRRLAFASPRGGTFSIWAQDLQGGQPVRLTDDQGLDAAPVWSPDGRYVAFLSNRGGEWGIWMVEAAGGTPRRLVSLGQVPGDWDVYKMAWR